VDGIITFPIALSGFLVLPDLPETTRAWFLTADERKLCVDRMLVEGRAQRKPYTKEKLKKILTSWHWWILVPMVRTTAPSTDQIGAFSCFGSYDD
jgi:MFS transporter, ACS family, pantothenate transporter